MFPNPAQNKEPEIPFSKEQLSLRDSAVPVYAHGATLKVNIFQRPWSTNAAFSVDPNIDFSQLGKAGSDLFVEGNTYDQVQWQCQLGCHDMYVVTESEGVRKVLTVIRTEPSSEPGVETAPLNGFRWPVGGRLRFPKPGSVLYSEQSPIGCTWNNAISSLHQLYRETGITPKQLQGVYHLGHIEVEFPKQMTYYGDGRLFGADDIPMRPVRLSTPTQAQGQLLVVLLKEGEMLSQEKLSTVTAPTWWSKSDIENPKNRSECSAPVLESLDAIVAGGM